MDETNTIRVVAALLMKGDKIFAAQRASGDLAGKWEFPGGKIEEGESPKHALVREIEEELSTEVEPLALMCNIKHRYPGFILDMDVFMCDIVEGRLEVEEGIHSAETWIELDKIEELDWAPADWKVVLELEELLGYEG